MYFRLVLGVLSVLAAGIIACASEPAQPMPSPPPLPPPPPPFLSFGAVSAGDVHTCGITTDGTGYCWGTNSDGQLGDGTAGDRPTPIRVAGHISLMMVDAGFRHTCALSTVGVAYCWGHNAEGELGDGTTFDRPTPTAVAVPAGFLFTSVSASNTHTCGVGGGTAGTTAGAVYCWGHNSVGQLGDATTTERLTPVPVAGGVTFATVSTGYLHTCGVGTDGAVYCWGYNFDGQLGDGTTTDRSSPTPVLGGLAFTAVRAGYLHTCGITIGGAVYCWGDNRSGQLGDGTTINQTSPVAVSGGLRFATVSAGYASSCGVNTWGDGYCWGRNAHGELGDGTTTDHSTPTRIKTFTPGGLAYAHLNSGGGHTCVVDEAAAAYCWGFNGRGQVGDGTTTDRLAPVRVAP